MPYFSLLDFIKKSICFLKFLNYSKHPKNLYVDQCQIEEFEAFQKDKVKIFLLQPFFSYPLSCHHLQKETKKQLAQVDTVEDLPRVGATTDSNGLLVSYIRVHVDSGEFVLECYYYGGEL